jgi:nitrogen PTS system EIIA component
VVLGSVFSPGLVKLDLESEDKDEVFEELIELYVSKNSASSRIALLSAIKSRESKLSTGVKPGVALPHAQTDQVSGVVGIIGISRDGIDYDALDGKPVHVIFLLFSSSEACSLHLRALKRLSLLLDDPEFIKSLISQKSSEGVYDTICKYEDMLATSM